MFILLRSTVPLINMFILLRRPTDAWSTLERLIKVSIIIINIFTKINYSENNQKISNISCQKKSLSDYDFSKSNIAKERE